jgi:hypothetical protein
MIVCKSSGEYEKEDGCVENVDTSHVLINEHYREEHKRN